MLQAKTCGVEGKSTITIGKERMDIGEELAACTTKTKEAGAYN